MQKCKLNKLNNTKKHKKLCLCPPLLKPNCNPRSCTVLCWEILSECFLWQLWKQWEARAGGLTPNCGGPQQTLLQSWASLQEKWHRTDDGCGNVSNGVFVTYAMEKEPFNNSVGGMKADLQSQAGPASTLWQPGRECRGVGWLAYGCAGACMFICVCVRTCVHSIKAHHPLTLERMKSILPPPKQIWGVCNLPPTLKGLEGLLGVESRPWGWE